MQKNSGVRLKGTFKGLEQKIEYLKNLGVTAVLLMPAYDYRETAGEQSSERRPEHPYARLSSAYEKNGGKSGVFEDSAPKQINCWGYRRGQLFCAQGIFLCHRPPYEGIFSSGGVTSQGRDGMFDGVLF